MDKNVAVREPEQVEQGLVKVELQPTLPGAVRPLVQRTTGSSLPWLACTSSRRARVWKWFHSMRKSSPRRADPSWAFSHCTMDSVVFQQWKLTCNRRGVS